MKNRFDFLTKLDELETKVFEQQTIINTLIDLAAMSKYPVLQNQGKWAEVHNPAHYKSAFDDWDETNDQDKRRARKEVEERLQNYLEYLDKKWKQASKTTKA